MYDRIKAILETLPATQNDGADIGRSRQGRPIKGFCLGQGSRRVSLLAGCHADEPVGPLLLRHVAAYLGALDPADPVLTENQWWIVPHINPDGERRNRVWHSDTDDAYELERYLAGVTRELPGDDIEFGFPRSIDDGDARPENRAVFAWWRTTPAPFRLHVSLHGMAFAAGPWFLIEAAWRDRCQLLERRCTERVKAMGYSLHDVERHGEKGFFRLGVGFCTRPDSRYMREHFLTLGDEEMAGRFRPSSMEAIRLLGGDALTLVSEMPLFLTPGVGDVLGPPDPAAEEWKGKIDGWRAALRAAVPPPPGSITSRAATLGLRPMAVRDQMVLQWTMIAAGLEQVGP